MSPDGIDLIMLMIVLVVITVIWPLFFMRRSSKSSVQPEQVHRAPRYASGGYVPGIRPYPGPQTELIIPRQLRSPLYLSPALLERMNAARRRRGEKPLNRAGIKAAIATAANENRMLGNRQPETQSDWLTYLILYECLVANHQSQFSGGVGGVVIDTTAPFNGQGGEFAGAGASGDWTAPNVAEVLGVTGVGIVAGAAAVAAVSDSQPGYSSSGAGVLDDSGGPATAPSDYRSVDTPSYTPEPTPEPTPSYTPDPTPTYSAPDPTPTYSAPDSGGGFSGGTDGS